MNKLGALRERCDREIERKPAVPFRSVENNLAGKGWNRRGAASGLIYANNRRENLVNL